MTFEEWMALHLAAIDDRLAHARKRCAAWAEEVERLEKVKREAETASRP